MSKIKKLLLTSFVLIFVFSFTSTAYAQDNADTSDNKSAIIKDHTLFVIENTSETRSVFNPNAIISIYAYDSNFVNKTLMGSILVYGTAVTDGQNLAIRDYSAFVYSNISNLVVDKTNLNAHSTSRSAINAQIHYYDPYQKTNIYTGCGLFVNANGTFEVYGGIKN